MKAASSRWFHLLLQLLHSLASPAVEVRADAGGNRGKGLFATKDFSKDDIIFQERPLVGWPSAVALLPASLELTTPAVATHALRFSRLQHS